MQYIDTVSVNANRRGKKKAPLVPKNYSLMKYVKENTHQTARKCVDKILNSLIDSVVAHSTEVVTNILDEIINNSIGTPPETDKNNNMIRMTMRKINKNTVSEKNICSMEAKISMVGQS